MERMRNKLTLECPAVYQIEIQGFIDKSRSDWFDKMEIFSTIDNKWGRITRLSGLVLDQAALRGILNKLYDLGLPLLSVNCQHVEPGKEL